jgi:nucleoside-diphosphate-sugar epimerase
MIKNKVMITGVAGLIGSHLLESLLELGYEVHGLDNVELASCHNLQAVAKHSNFKYYYGDIRRQQDLVDFFQSDASVLYHLASVVGVNRYMEDPLSLIDVGVAGTRSLIGLCHAHGVRMLFASTSEVYGRNTEVPWPENGDRVLGPTNVDRWSYSTAKALCEHMLFGVHHKDGWPMSIVRFFNVYGPRQNPIYVVSKSVHRVLNGLQPELYDGGKQTRCFTFIDDVIEGMVKAATSDKAIGQIINLGNPTENSMSEVVQAVLDASDSRLIPLEISTQEKYGSVYEDIPRRVPDVSKALQLLEWEPKTSMLEGVGKTVQWAKRNQWYLD